MDCLFNTDAGMDCATASAGHSRAQQWEDLRTETCCRLYGTDTVYASLSTNNDSKRNAVPSSMAPIATGTTPRSKASQASSGASSKSTRQFSMPCACAGMSRDWRDALPDSSEPKLAQRSILARVRCTGGIWRPLPMTCNLFQIALKLPVDVVDGKVRREKHALHRKVEAREGQGELPTLVHHWQGLQKDELHVQDGTGRRRTGGGFQQRNQHRVFAVNGRFHRNAIDHRAPDVGFLPIGSSLRKEDAQELPLRVPECHKDST